MFWNSNRGTTATLGANPARADGKRLRAMIDQATRDSVDESDEHAGLLSVIREEVACPFAARLHGEDVECVRLEWPRTGYGLNAICKSRGRTDVVDISQPRVGRAPAQGTSVDRSLFRVARPRRLNRRSGGPLSH